MVASTPSQRLLIFLKDRIPAHRTPLAGAIQASGKMHHPAINCKELGGGGGKNGKLCRNVFIFLQFIFFLLGMEAQV